MAGFSTTPAELLAASSSLKAARAELVAGRGGGIAGGTGAGALDAALSHAAARATLTAHADEAATSLGKKTTVKVDGVTGHRPTDERLANKAAGFSSTPKGYSWHHVEDCKHMQLVPTKVHRPTTHSGCVQMLRNGIVDPAG